MSSIPVKLPDHLVSYVAQGAERAGYSSAGEYIAALVEAASEKQGEIEQALVAGIASGPAEAWTDDQWQAIKRPCRNKGIWQVNSLKPIFRRSKAAEDVEQHAMYIADGSIDAALRFLERAEQTIKGLALFPASGAPFPSCLPELEGMRTRLVKDFPNHVVFYIEREETIEVVRVLCGGQDMSVEVEKN